MIRTAFLLAGMLLTGIPAYNQFPKDNTATGISQHSLQPVQWEYSAKKVTNKIYELHLTAIIKPGWHLYAQKQPEDAIAVPTAIKFDYNPLMDLRGSTIEIGKKEKFTVPSLGIFVWQYENKVDFVQLVTLRQDVKTRVTGSVTFQTCTPEQCLPPETVSFQIAIND